mmetsp:Transcript_21698/g.65861  ORF Transcript_21698/g.65861 Transcript_21698/m.65861 type:complete len:204 (-) Transcript_21698:1276-1887(-)
MRRSQTPDVIEVPRRPWSSADAFIAAGGSEFDVGTAVRGDSRLHMPGCGSANESRLRSAVYPPRAWTTSMSDLLARTTSHLLSPGVCSPDCRLEEPASAPVTRPAMAGKAGGGTCGGHDGGGHPCGQPLRPAGGGRVGGCHAGGWCGGPPAHGPMRHIAGAGRRQPLEEPGWEAPAAGSLAPATDDGGPSAGGVGAASGRTGF